MHGVLAALESEFVPTDFGSGCVLWLTARTGVTLGTGTNVATWADRSSYGNNAVSTGGMSPTYETSGGNLINGQRTIRFGVNNGGNTRMEIADAASLKPTTAISCSCVVRFQTSIDNFQVLFTKTTDPAQSTDGWAMFNPLDTDSAQGMYINIYTNHAEATGLSINTNYILTGIYTGSAMEYYVNGTLAQSVPYSTPISYPSPSTLLIGQAATYANLTGLIPEIVVCNFALNTSQRQLLERGYFERVYGIDA